MVQLNQELKLSPENLKQELRPNKLANQHHGVVDGESNPIHPNQQISSTNVATDFQEATNRARKSSATNSSKKTRSSN